MGVWAQACFRNEARRGASPGQVLTALNRELVSMDQPEAFVALACMRIDVRPARLTYANAGLTPPLLRRANGSVEILSESGVLLGVTSRGAVRRHLAWISRPATSWCCTPTASPRRGTARTCSVPSGSPRC